MMLKCEVCNTLNPEATQICDNCGVSLRVLLARLYLDRAAELVGEGKYDVAAQALGRADQEMVQLGPQHPASREMQARSLYIQGMANYGRGKMEQASADLQQAVQQLELDGDPHLLARTLRVLGNIYYLQDQLDRAADCYRRSEEGAAQVGAYDLAAVVVANMGNIAVAQNNIAAATAFYQQGLAYAERDGSPDALGSSYHAVMWFCANYGPFNRALDYVQRSLKVLDQITLPEYRVAMMGDIGLIYTRLGDYEPAERYLLAAMDLADEAGYQISTEWIAAHLTELMQRRGDGKGWLMYATRGFNNPNTSTLNKVIFGERLALYYTYHRDAAHAHPLLDWCRQSLAKQAFRVGRGTLERMQAYLQFAVGDYRAAGTQFQRALTNNTHSPYEEAAAWEEYARLTHLYVSDAKAMQTQAQAAIAEANALYTQVGLPIRATQMDELARTILDPPPIV